MRDHDKTEKNVRATRCSVFTGYKSAMSTRLPTASAPASPSEKAAWRSQAKSKGPRVSLCTGRRLLGIFSGPNKTKPSFVQHKSQSLAKPGATLQPSRKKQDEGALEVHGQKTAPKLQQLSGQQRKVWDCSKCCDRDGPPTRIRKSSACSSVS